MIQECEVKVGRNQVVIQYIEDDDGVEIISAQADPWVGVIELEMAQEKALSYIFQCKRERGYCD